MRTHVISQEAMGALDLSINKWYGILYHGWADTGAVNCMLCKYADDVYNGEPDPCYHCPVFADVGINNCDNTPYEGWIELFNKGEDKIADDARRFEAAKKMLAYLIGLKERCIVEEETCTQT